jgi:hypothetical protein
VSLSLSELGRFGKLLGGRLRIGSEEPVYICGKQFEISDANNGHEIQRTEECPLYVGEEDDAGTCHAMAASLRLDTGSLRNGHRPAIYDHLNDEFIRPLSGIPDVSEVRESLEAIIRC